MPESKEVASLALRFGMISGEVNVVDAVERSSFNTTTFDWYVGHLSRKRLGEVVISEPIFAGGCFWRVYFYPQGIVSQDFTSLYIESVEASKEDCPPTFKAFLTVKIFIDPEIVSKPKGAKKEAKGPANDDIGDSASQVGSEGGSEQGSQVSARSGSAAGSRSSKAGSALSKSSRLKSQASSVAASSCAASKHSSQLSAKGGGSKTEQEIMNVQSWNTEKPWRSMASSYSKTNSKLGFADFFDKSVFFNKKAGMMMYVRGDKKLETSFLDGVAKLRFSLTAVCDFDHAIVEDPEIDEYGRQKTKWVVRNFWGLQKQLPWGEKITSEEFTSGQRFCFQMFPSGYCSSVDQALKLQLNAANEMLGSPAMSSFPAELKPIKEMCCKVQSGILPPDAKNPLHQDTSGAFSSSSGYLSLFLHYGEDPISRNTVSKAVFQLGVVLQKKDPTGFICPDRDILPGGVYWIGADLKTTNPASGEAEKGCLYYPQPPPGHVLYPSRKTYGKQKFIELEKLHNCTFVSGDFQNGGDITFVLNMLVTQREVINFRSMVRDVNIAQNDAFPVANKRKELIVSKRPYQLCEECEGPLQAPILYCSCCGAARCSQCLSSVSRIPGYGYEDYSWKKLREYARPADPSIVTKVLQKSTVMMGSAADQVSSTGLSLTSSIFSYAQAVGERVKSLLPTSAPSAVLGESEQEKSDRLAAASTMEAGADMIRKNAAEQRAKDAAEQRAKAAKEVQEKEADEAMQNPSLTAIAALKPQPKPKELPNEVQKRPNDPSQRQPCRLYPWLALWKRYEDKELSTDGGDIKYVHVRQPFSPSEAAMRMRDPSLPIVSSYLDKEIGWITHTERANFEDPLFSQPIGRCCEGRLQEQRQALNTLVEKTQHDLKHRADASSQNDGSTQRSNASNSSSAAAAAEEDDADLEDDGNDELIAMLPSYEISKSGTIKWTYMDKMGGKLDQLKPIRKHARPDDLKSYLPARHMCVGVLARGQIQEPLVHDQHFCSTVMDGEKAVIDPVSKQQKTEKFKYTCKEPITPKNACTCASCGKTFCNKPTCMFSNVELEEFEAPEGNGPKEKKASVLRGSVCASCKLAREEAKGAWIVKAPKPEEEPERPGLFAPLLALFSPPPLTEEQMEKEKDRQEKADEKFQDKKYKFLGKISFGLIKRPEED